MCLFRRTPEQRLKAEFLKGGRVCLASGPGEREAIQATKLAELLRSFSRRTGDNRCESFELQGFCVDGKLDLHGAGLEGSPILPMRFIDCTLPGGVNVEEAFLKGLVIERERARECGASAKAARDSTPQAVTSSEEHPCAGHSQREAPQLWSLCARGVTVLDEFRISSMEFKPDAHIDLSHARLKGGARLQDLKLEHSSESATTPVIFRDAVVTGDLLLEGVRLRVAEAKTDGEGKLISAKCEHAFDGENLTVTGVLKLKHHNVAKASHRSKLHGTLNLRGVKVGGQVILESVKLIANKPHDKTLSLMAEGAEIGADLCFYDEDHCSQGDKQYPRFCEVKGQINLMGAHVHGDLRVFGDYKSTDQRIRVFKAERLHVDGDMHFGWIPGGQGHTTCSVIGECDFSNATVEGEVIFSGSTHKLSDIDLAAPEHKKVRRKKGVAVNLRGATIAGDLRCEGSKDRPCCIQGLSAIGAKIEGRLLVRGAEIIAKQTDGENRKAISANGATIRGGILVEGDDFSHGQYSRIDGGFRLRNATVNGPVIFTGATLSADDIAFWASNTFFGTDVIFMPSWKMGTKAHPTTIFGEVRLLGATVTGTLYFKGVVANGSRQNGVVLDGYTGDFRKGVVVEPYLRFEHELPNDSQLDGSRKAGEEFLSSQIEGLISLNFAKSQSFRFGTVALRDPVDATRSVTLYGALLLRGLQLQGDVEIANVTIQPVAHIKDPIISEEAEKRLKTLGVHRDDCVIHANYANLGTRLYVRLNEESCGLINLYGATTGTIGGFSGNTQSLAQRTHDGRSGLLAAYFGFGEVNPATREQRLREGWGRHEGAGPAKDWGRPRNTDHAKRTILLNLDEFTYKRVNDYDEMPQCGRDFVRKFCYLVLGRPTPQQLRPRLGWLQRQVANPHTRTPAIISPYRQLASVYREMGDLKRSYMYLRERRWLLIRFGKNGTLQNFIDRLFSMCFGFGYSPPRALATLGVLFLFSLTFVFCAATRPFSYNYDHTSTGQPPDVRAQVSPSVMEFEVRHSAPQADTSRLCAERLCSPPDSSGVCHLTNRNDRRAYDFFSESFRLILPFTRLAAGSDCILNAQASPWYRFYLASLQVLSWILFPMAALTFSGVLREKDP